MTIAEQFASRYEALVTDSNNPAYDEAAVMQFEEDMYGESNMIPVDPEDEHCTDYLYAFEDGSAMIDGKKDMKIATPETIKELQQLQRHWEKFQREWFFEHPSYDRRSVFDRKECAEDFRDSVLHGSGEVGPTGSEE
jgi:hypothetical protein